MESAFILHFSFFIKMYTDKGISSQTCSHFHIFFNYHETPISDDIFHTCEIYSQIQGVSCLSRTFFFLYIFSSYKMAFNILHSIFNPHIILIKCLKFGNIKSVLVLCHTSQICHGSWILVFLFFHFFDDVVRFVRLFEI